MVLITGTQGVVLTYFAFLTTLNIWTFKQEKVLHEGESILPNTNYLAYNNHCIIVRYHVRCAPYHNGVEWSWFPPKSHVPPIGRQSIVDTSWRNEQTTTEGSTSASTNTLKPDQVAAQSMRMDICCIVSKGGALLESCHASRTSMETNLLVLFVRCRMIIKSSW